VPRNAGTGPAPTDARRARRRLVRARAVIDLRREPERDLGHLAITIAGGPARAVVELDGRPSEPGPFQHFSALRTATVALPSGSPPEVAVWIHRVSPDGTSTDVPASVDVASHNITISPHQGGRT